MTEKNSKEEIDILSLFSLIGKKTNSLFVSIINFFINILNLFVYILFEIKKKYIILSISIIIGALTGYVYEKNFFVPSYTTTLTLSPNFGSTYHLYENIKFYQSLIEQKDFEKLNVYLNIDSTNSNPLQNISIKPYKNVSLNLKCFKTLLNTADSNTGKSLSYNDFVDKIPFESYSFHVITLQTTKSEIPKELEQSIIKSLENNKYYLNLKNTYLENLKIEKDYIESSIIKLDTLLFSNFNINNSRSGNLGTTILLDDKKNQDTYLKLFDKYNSLKDQVIKINYQLENKKNVINIIDSFKVLGNLNNKISFKFNGALILFLTSLFIVLLPKIYKKLVILNSPNIKRN